MLHHTLIHDDDKSIMLSIHGFTVESLHGGPMHVWHQQLQTALSREAVAACHSIGLVITTLPGYQFSATIVSLGKNFTTSTSANQLLNQDILYILHSGNIL